MPTTTNFVIPCLNAEETIAPCIEAILASAENIDLVVVDNGSTDQTVEVAQRYDCAVIQAPLETVAGLRNLGAKQGEGEFIAFVDSDCVLPPGWLGTALGYFSDDDVAMVGAYHYDSPDTLSWLEESWSFYLRSMAKSGEADSLPTRALLVRRKVFEELNGFDSGLVSAEDVDFGYRLTRSHKILAIPELAPVHLDDPQSLKELFLKERWRGASGLKVARRNFHRLSEIRSVLVAAYYALFSVLLPASMTWAIIKGQPGILLINVLLLVIPGILIALIVAVKNNAPARFVPLFVVFSTYFFARALALIWRS